ncbi:uncharacterized protein LOC130759225 isoform X1 [Actinidia eriantha]|uniref:uncharacterized protein LOC130759225 isoform X1 n=1 Tax=Actinidia eriantha TaxID=165200 RepID=UPI00258DDC11|nr:uncharacterized protein LOC130759225 isoform X1 [Actinidia eriantha]
MVSLSSSNLKALSGCTKALFHYGDVRFHSNTISTPTIKGTILPGITRKSIIDVAQSQGFQIVYVEVWQQDDDMSAIHEDLFFGYLFLFGSSFKSSFFCFSVMFQLLFLLMMRMIRSTYNKHYMI